MMKMISGIKPTNFSLTLGNYLGAIKPFVKYQDQYELSVFIADLHAITIFQDPDVLRQNTENLIATYLAAGLDPEKCTIFKQSDIPAHSQLEWVLTCNTDLPDLTKMPQYKNYLATHSHKAVPTGMLMYPSLMNADILLYDADYVPVGIDQKPHVDLTRFVAEKFNKVYGEVFKLPTAFIAEQGAKIMSLSDPTKKMSKSESDKGTIYLLDDEQTVRTKIRKAVTDAEAKIYYDAESKKGISNLLTIMSILTSQSIESLESYYRDEKDYGKFKSDVADVVWAELYKLQTKIKDYKDRPEITRNILANGAINANMQAEQKLAKVYKAIGIK